MPAAAGRLMRRRQAGSRRLTFRAALSAPHGDADAGEDVTGSAAILPVQGSPLDHLLPARRGLVGVVVEQRSLLVGHQDVVQAGVGTAGGRGAVQHEVACIVEDAFGGIDGGHRVRTILCVVVLDHVEHGFEATLHERVAHESQRPGLVGLGADDCRREPTPADIRIRDHAPRVGVALSLQMLRKRAFTAQELHLRPPGFLGVLLREAVGGAQQLRHRDDGAVRCTGVAGLLRQRLRWHPDAPAARARRVLRSRPAAHARWRERGRRPLTGDESKRAWRAGPRMDITADRGSSAGRSPRSGRHPRRGCAR
jgi:hypothetical protein